MIKATLLELYIKKRGSVPIISEPMSFTWIQVSFPTCLKNKKIKKEKKRKEKKRKDESLFEEKKEKKKLI